MITVGCRMISDVFLASVKLGLAVSNCALTWITQEMPIWLSIVVLARWIQLTWSSLEQYDKDTVGIGWQFTTVYQLTMMPTTTCQLAL